MFNKLKFNNLVISHKKKIQQARTQTINKIVHKIRNIKSLLDKKPDDEKIKDRLRKNTENVEQLKKLKCLDVMRQVLLLDGKQAAIITNGRATPEEVAIALLAMNKIMQVLEKQFRSELKLNDDKTAAWRKDIMELSKRRAKIERTEDKRRKRKALKEQKSTERKRKEWLEQNQSTTLDDKDAETQNTTDTLEVEQETVVELGEQKQETKTVKSKQEKKNKINKPNKQKRTQETLTETTSSSKKLQNASNINTPTTDTTSSSKKLQNASSEVKENKSKKRKQELAQDSFETKSHKQLLNEEAERQQEVENYKTEIEDENSVTHVVDPFFITETGENYLSTAIAQIGQHADVDSDEDYTNGRRFSEKHRPQRNERTNRTDFGADRQHQKRQRDFDGNRQKRDFGKNRQEYNFKNVRENQTNRVQSRDQDNQRHPSWLAKQKLKPIISKFEGKKITFDEDATPKHTSDMSHSISVTRNKQPAKTIEANAGMHPSWVAKQKFKPKIAAFEGKKITFDNGDD